MFNENPKTLANDLSQCLLARDCRNSDLDRYEIKPALFQRILGYLMKEEPRPRAKYEEIGKFCVWTKTGRRPQYYHPTQELAMEEAERLSLKYPGQKFIVMQMIGKFGTPPVEETT